MVISDWHIIISKKVIKVFSYTVVWKRKEFFFSTYDAAFEFAKQLVEGEDFQTSYAFLVCRVTEDETRPKIVWVRFMEWFEDVGLYIEHLM